ncbi:unnamed protein product [Cylicocyclus nassatus]|uniref:Invertebrate defensins family profile domain-containing protein n=1 Tax=Cylicocyclus nassatus TaxID=53992 RepID=A0AA36M424_CYLNA|nr:unnamed protein product [Cylicocyclus nassatus]CAJ0596961.1 unnamed protein product [Cylicocyclus nassatus]
MKLINYMLLSIILSCLIASIEAGSICGADGLVKARAKCKYSCQLKGYGGGDCKGKKDCSCEVKEKKKELDCSCECTCFP